MGRSEKDQMHIGDRKLLMRQIWSLTTLIRVAQLPVSIDVGRSRDVSAPAS